MDHINKNTFEHIKDIINKNESINSLKSFCIGYGLNINSYASAVHITCEQITIRYRRKNFYVSYNYSKIYGTTYFNKIQ